MPTSRTEHHRPEGPGATDPVTMEAALCGLLQALQVDPRAVRLTPGEADALLAHIHVRRERERRAPHTFLV
jgi:hypothetical protein